MNYNRMYNSVLIYKHNIYKCKQVSNSDIGFEELTAFPDGSVKISKYPAVLLQRSS